jgi:hypothetical protein
MVPEAAGCRRETLENGARSEERWILLSFAPVFCVVLEEREKQSVC